MSTKVTDLGELAATPDNADVLHIVDVGDGSGGTAGTSKKITVSNLLASAGSVDSVNGQTGVVVLDVNDLDDVISLSPTQGDVLQWNSGISKWIESSQLTTLWAEFRNGTSVNVYADGSTATQGRLELTATGANVKTGVTGMTVTETSPGDIEFTVATDATGSTAHTAVHIDGTTTGNQTEFLLKAGTKLQISNGTRYTWLRANSANTQPTTLDLPSGNGTLALTSDLPNEITVNTQAANRLVACSSTTDTLDGEANLTFDGSELIVTGSVTTDKINITTTGVGSTGGYGEGSECFKNGSGTVVAGKLYAFTSGGFVQTNASSVSLLSTGLIGMAITTSAADGLVTKGVIQLADAVGGNVGDVVYLDTTAGQATTTAVSGTTGFVSRVIGYKLSTNVIYFDPSKDWIEIS